MLTEVTTVAAAEAVRRYGTAGLVAVGVEAAGKVGELSSFVLLQKVLAGEPALPVWVRGGIGTRTAAAVVAGGAAGVVLDAQLSPLAEADVAERRVAAGHRLDGATDVVAGYRVEVPPSARDRRGGPRRDDTRRRPRPGCAPRRRRRSSPWGRTLLRRESRRPLRHRRAHRPGCAEAIADPDPTVPCRPHRAVGDSPLCAALRLRRPVVQGPMTRVSDTPEFALAVADDGAMPCMAMALADREATARLLHRTRDLLATGPGGWAFSASPRRRSAPPSSP